MNLKEEVKKYIEIIKSGNLEKYKNGFNKYSGAYIKTTENVNGYYDLMDFDEKSVLTVIGSSDQIFEAISRGAKNVTGFDISLNAILFYYLKEAAIKSLSFEEFVTFFFVERRCFNKNTYNKLRSYLNSDVLEFWDMVFNREDDQIFDFISNFLIDNKGLYLSYRAAEMKLSKLSAYISEPFFNYLKTQLNFARVSIYLSDVNNLDSIDGYYDYIILSNIFEYQKGEDLEKFKASIDRYRSKLVDGGKIIVGYAYHDVDLGQYDDYEKESIPSRYMAWDEYGAPYDMIMSVNQKL